MPAHATLFHALPGDAEDEVRAALTAGGTEGFPVEVAGPRLLGRGVAFPLRSDELLRRRAAIARRFAGRLTRQDGARYSPHVTVQNKVTPDEARALQEALAASFTPWTTQAAAFELWRYLGGPWAAVLSYELGEDVLS